MSGDGQRLSNQLSSFDIIQSIYCMDGELVLDPSSIIILEDLREGKAKEDLNVQLNVTVEEDKTVPLTVTLHLLEGPLCSIDVQRCKWLSTENQKVLSAEAQRLLSESPEDDAAQTIMAFVDSIRDFAASLPAIPKVIEEVIEEKPAPQPVKKETKPIEKEETKRREGEPFSRAWFHLPSLSTRSKRDDLVNYAKQYDITGFVFAGKPALICLEAPSIRLIDDYWKEIKTYSWGDIPAGHKKVSERFREEFGEGKENRAFSDMREITDMFGPMQGARGNRGDLSELRKWMEGRGVGEQFAQVMMGAGNA
ncbi:hypothetical protein PROFUN_00534 [Planoprotostelium fungivorum]|uniref:Small nuclear ribonucleoprotein Prp3 C-terminal domain-containing protein n=1 Tax=Planoprotostelium fungivorum TaxID=1890364 RepID=A0A2P6N148_9EUKA|nr:hypothetical protein PROFUN_00534 [Planoprotostelium fungivorum]